MDLQDNELTDVGAVALANGLAGPEGALKTLQLGYNDLSAEGAAALLARCHHSPNSNPDNAGPSPCSLTSLDLQFNELGPGVAEVVAAALRGRGASLANSNNSNARPPAGLTTLGLLQTGLGSSGAAAIAEALRTNTVLRSLDLGNNEIGDEGVAALALALQPQAQREAGGLATAAEDGSSNSSKSTLAHLFLFDNGIEGAGAAALASLLTHNEQVTFLDLEENDALDDEDNPEVAASMARIEAGLQRNRKAKINRAAMTIADTDAGATQLAAGAEPESTDSSAAAESTATAVVGASAVEPPCGNVTILNFEGDGLGDEGALLLSDVLFGVPKSSTVAGVLLPAIEVVLDDCGITEAGALRLAECCETQPRLTQLSLKFNPIFKHGAANFDEGDEDEDEGDVGGVVSGDNGASTSSAAERIDNALTKNREARSRG